LPPKQLANIFGENDIRSRLASRVGCALILALTVAVTLIAGDQEKSVSVEIVEKSIRGNLPAIIDK